MFNIIKLLYVCIPLQKNIHQSVTKCLYNVNFAVNNTILPKKKWKSNIFIAFHCPQIYIRKQDLKNVPEPTLIWIGVLIKPYLFIYLFCLSLRVLYLALPPGRLQYWTCPWEINRYSYIIITISSGVIVIITSSIRQTDTPSSNIDTNTKAFTVIKLN